MKLQYAAACHLRKDSSGPHVEVEVIGQHLMVVDVFHPQCQIAQGAGIVYQDESVRLVLQCSLPQIDGGAPKKGWACVQFWRGERQYQMWAQPTMQLLMRATKPSS